MSIHKAGVAGAVGAALLEAALDVIPARITVWGLDQRLLYGNLMSLEYFGVTGDQVYGLTIRECFEETGPGSLVERLEHALAGTAQWIEHMSVPREGESNYADLYVGPITVDGAIHGAVTLSADNTRRLQARQEAEASESDAAIRGERLKLAFALDAEVSRGLAAAVDLLTAALNAGSSESASLRAAANARVGEAIAALRGRILSLQQPDTPVAAPPVTVSFAKPLEPLSNVLGETVLPEPLQQWALDAIPVPIAGWDPYGEVAFVNIAAQQLFATGPWLEEGKVSWLLGSGTIPWANPFGAQDKVPGPQEFVRTVRVADGSTTYHQVNLVPHLLRGERVGTVGMIRDITSTVEVENKRVEIGRRAAVLRDRLTIAENLHDLVIQALFAAGLLVGGPRGAAPERIRSAIEAIENAQDELRQAVLELGGGADRPRVDLRLSLGRVVREAAQPVDFPVQLAYDGEAMLPMDIASDAVAVVREALSNAIRHSGASLIDVRVSCSDRSVQLVVSDNGSGIGEVTRSSGLANMAERARRKGGICRRPEATVGTVIEWWVPFA